MPFTSADSVRTALCRAHAASGVTPPGGEVRCHVFRHFGILGNNCRAETLRQARDALGVAELPKPEPCAEGRDGGEESRDADVAPVACPHCGGILRMVEAIPRPRRTGHASRDPPRAASAQETAT